MQVLESTSNQFVCSIEEVICYRIQVLESTSNQLARSLEQVTCYRIQVYDLTSNQAMCSVDRLTYHRTQLINLTSNRAICQMPLPCPLTFRASSIKHWIPIQIPPPFHYPNTPYQIPHQVHPHRPKRQSQTTNRLTNPHSICTSTPSKERVQATNNRLLTTLYLYIPSFGGAWGGTTFSLYFCFGGAWGGCHLHTVLLLFFVNSFLNPTFLSFNCVTSPAQNPPFLSTL